jgi:hypothetical protein
VGYSHKFIGNTKFMDDRWSYQSIFFDYKNKNIINTSYYAKKLKFRDTVPSKKKWNDGLSLFYLARQYTDLKKNIKIPTFIYRDTSYTFINFQGERKETEVDAIDYPVKTIYFDGVAKWKGFYGLSGNFEGWFSDDEARIPIKALMNVQIGTVTIELIKWRRKGWKPPKA